MKKMLFLSCLLIPVATHCMEKEVQVTNRTLQYSDIADEVCKLEKALYANQHWVYQHGGTDPLKYLVMCKYPDRSYGYVEKNGAGDYCFGSLCTYGSKELAKMDSLKNANYNGFSPIGAVTLSTTIHYDEQKQIIQKLRKAGCVPTEKDKILTLHLEQETNHNRPDGTSDLLDDHVEESSRCNLLHQFCRAIVYLCNLCPINLTQEDKQNLHLE